MPSVESKDPFYHMIIDEFLSNESLERIRKFYDENSFNAIHSDLFRFLQSADLSTQPGLAFFRNELDAVFKKLHSLDRREYNIFASFYRSGDYLRCHDDMIEDRVYAFTFYLDDFSTGELILYKRDCTTEGSRIKVKSNRLVIFQVSEASFHEVARCEEDGRKAISGWFTHPDISNELKSEPKPLHVHENITWYELPSYTLEEDSFTLLEFEDINSEELRREIQGPFVNRRCTEIFLAEYFVPSFENYRLMHVEYLYFDKNSYLLLNDKINGFDEDILDVFIFNSREYVSNFITVIDPSGEIIFHIDAVPSHMLIGKRGCNNMCILGTDTPVEFKHYMYVLEK